MKIVADTNVLLRDALHDDPRQSPIAGKVLQRAELVAIPVAVLCEFVWVLRQGYKRPAAEVAHSIRALIDSENVVSNRPAVEAGLEFLQNGGDFADGGGDAVFFKKLSGLVLVDIHSAEIVWRDVRMNTPNAGIDT